MCTIMYLRLSPEACISGSLIVVVFNGASVRCYTVAAYYGLHFYIPCLSMFYIVTIA